MIRIVDAVIEGALAVLMATLVGIVFVSVFFRYVVQDPIVWSEEAGRLCLVWTSFLGTYVAHRRAEHIAMTAIRDRAPLGIQIAIKVFITLTLIAFFAVLAWYGSKYAIRFMDSMTPILRIPMGFVYAAMPISAGLILLNLLITCVGSCRNASTLTGERSE